MTRPNSPDQQTINHYHHGHHHHSSSRRQWMICIMCALVGYINISFLTNYASKQSFVSTTTASSNSCNTQSGFYDKKFSSSALSASSSSPLISYPNKKVSKLLPNRLISVFGLESSGTTFTTMALARALGFKDATHDDFERGEFRMIDPHTERTVEIQHFSLPWGSYGGGGGGSGGGRSSSLSTTTSQNVKNQMPPTIPVIPPQECMIQTNQFGRNIPQTIWDNTAGSVGIDFNKHECETLLRASKNGGGGGGISKIKTPLRWFLDITSHIQWYSERGVDATAVIVVRDTSIHFRGVYKNHVLHNATAAEEQHQVGLNIINKALTTLISNYNPIKLDNGENNYYYPNGGAGAGAGGQQFNSPQLILVSYETLMSLKEPYLKSIYDQLHISSGYVPTFHDGNSKYVIPVDR